MPFPIAGAIGGMIATRLGFAATSGNIAKTFVRSPLVQGGMFGYGYTSASYGGYGVSNTWDPLGVHRPKYKQTSQTLGIMAFRRRYYGRRSYYSRYGRRYRRRRSYRRNYRRFY